MDCQECEKRQIRIEQLEGMVQRMAESFDAYLDEREVEKTKVRAVEQGSNAFREDIQKRV